LSPHAGRRANGACLGSKVGSGPIPDPSACCVALLRELGARPTLGGSYTYESVFKDQAACNTCALLRPGSRPPTLPAAALADRFRSVGRAF
jgi:hypothetical protein